MRSSTMPQCGTLNWNAPDVPIAPGPSLTIGPVTLGVVAGGGVVVTFAATRPRRDASSSERSFAGAVISTIRHAVHGSDIYADILLHTDATRDNDNRTMDDVPSAHPSRLRRRAPEAFRVRRGAEASLLADGAVREGAMPAGHEVDEDVIAPFHGSE